MPIPQFRRNPPLPLNLNAIRPAPLKENVDKNITDSKENLKKFNNVKQTNSNFKGKANHFLQTQKNNGSIEVDPPKPQCKGLRKTVKSKAPLIHLEEQKNRLSQHDEAKHYRKSRCDEERLRNMPTDKIIPNTVTVFKPQRQMSTTSAVILNTRLNQSKNADKKIYSTVKDYAKNERQLNAAAVSQEFIPHVRKPKLGYAKESKSFQLKGQTYRNNQVEDLQALFGKCNFDENK